MSTTVSQQISTLARKRTSLGVNSTMSFRDIRNGSECGAVCPACGTRVSEIAQDARWIVFGVCREHPTTLPWMVAEDNKASFGRAYQRKSKPKTISPVEVVRSQGHRATRDASRYTWTLSDAKPDAPPSVMAWCWVCSFKRVHAQHRTYRTDYRCKRHPNSKVILFDPHSGATWLGNGWDKGKQRGQPQYTPYPAYRREWQPG